MQPIKRLTPFIAVAGQLEPADIGALAASECRAGWPGTEGPWMPSIYFDLMLKGHEWLAEPRHPDFEPRPLEAPAACDFSQEKK